MKKITPYIFLFLIFVNLFAPFTPDFKNKKLVSAVNKAEAADELWYISGTDGFYKANGPYTSNADCIAARDKDPNPKKTSIGLGQFSIDGCYATAEVQTIMDAQTTRFQNNTSEKYWFNIFNMKTGELQHRLAVSTGQLSCEWEAIKYVINNQTDPATLRRDGDCYTATNANVVTAAAVANKEIADSVDGLPVCLEGGAIAIFPKIHPLGCVANLLYGAVFVPSAWILYFAGSFFDFTFGYSVNSESYTNDFVVQGWGIVRDFCNMFFIFILLYIAISTILDLHGFKTKEMIINVVIIGILINFSMLAAHLMIDSSNILARVFYNEKTFGAKKNGEHILLPKADGTGYLGMSALIVGKFNPQELVLNGGKNDLKNATTANNLATNNNGSIQQTGETDAHTGITNGAFILITLLSIVMCLIGSFVFLSVGIIFVARVIGLWFAMIFAPLAFLSYTVPQMQNMKMFGWKNWWHETFQLCFLAPIFIFFLYLMVAFLDKGLGIAGADKLTGMAWWIGIIVPFVFIMALMMRAKDMAKEYSGTLGQQITSGLAAAGGLALGAGAAGIAMAGRNTIGQFGKLVANDGAREKALKFQDLKDATGKIKGWGAVNPFNYINVAAKAVTSTGKFAVAVPAMIGGVKVGEEIKTGNKKEVTAAIPAVLGMKGPGGEREIITPGVDAVYEDETRKKTLSDVWREKEKAPRDTSHAKQIFDEKLKAMHIEDPWKDVGTDQQDKVKESIDKDLLAKQYFKAKDYSSLKKEMKDDIDNMYKGTGTIITENNSFGKKGDSIKDLIAKENPDNLRNGNLRATENGHLHDAEDLEFKMKGSGIAVGEFLAAVRKGTYDLRNLDQIKTGSKGFGVKSMVGLTAAVALGMRSGIKQSGVDYGKGSKDFMKDMGDLITSSLKSVKVVVPKAEGGGDSHGGGDHGGGHH